MKQWKFVFEFFQEEKNEKNDRGLCFNEVTETLFFKIMFCTFLYSCKVWMVLLGEYNHYDHDTE